MAPGRQDGPGYEILGEAGAPAAWAWSTSPAPAVDRVVALNMISLAGGHAGAADWDALSRRGSGDRPLAAPNIVSGLRTVGEHDGLPFFSLESGAGRHPGQKARRHCLRAEGRRRPWWSAGPPMHAAHAKKASWHRDLKPAKMCCWREQGSPGAGNRANRNPGNSAPLLLLQASPTPIQKLPISASPRSSTRLARPRRRGDGPRRATCPRASTTASRRSWPGLRRVCPRGESCTRCLTGAPFQRRRPRSTPIMQVVSDEPVPPRQLNAQGAGDRRTVCISACTREPARRFTTAHRAGGRPAALGRASQSRRRRWGAWSALEVVRRNPCGDGGGGGASGEP